MRWLIGECSRYMDTTTWYRSCRRNGIKPVSLVFEDARREAGFVDRQSEIILFNMNFLVVTQLLVGTPIFMAYASGCSLRMNLQRFGWVLFLGGVSAGLTRYTFVRYEVSSTTVETAAAIFLIIDIAWAPLVDSWYSNALHGDDPMALWSDWNYFSDSRVLLYIMAVLLTSHFCLPIRWCKMLAVEFACVWVYTVCIFVGSPEDTVFSLTNLSMLAAIVIVCAIGKRTLERHERQALVAYLCEKELRYLSEFKLSLLETQTSLEPGQSERSAAGSKRSSVESTSERAFDLDHAVKVGQAEQWMLCTRDLIIDPSRVLGIGSFGMVFSGRFCGAPVAVKAPRALLHNQGDKVVFESFLNEFRILRRLRHPNIVSLIGAIVDVSKHYFALVLEEVVGVDLEAFVSGAEDAGASSSASSRTMVDASDRLCAVCEIDCSAILMDVSFALQYLHSRKPNAVVHGDLKTSNVFVEKYAVFSKDGSGTMTSESTTTCDSTGPSTCRAKLLDFGLARVLSSSPGRLGGTLQWIAPETLDGDTRPDTPVDVFGFSRLAFFLFKGELPLLGKSRQEVINLLRRGSPWGDCDWSATCKAIETASRSPLRNLMPRLVMCGQTDPEMRPTMSSLVRSVMSDYGDAVDTDSKGISDWHGALDGVRRALVDQEDCEQKLFEQELLDRQEQRLESRVVMSTNLPQRQQQKDPKKEQQQKQLPQRKRIQKPFERMDWGQPLQQQKSDGSGVVTRSALPMVQEELGTRQDRFGSRPQELAFKIQRQKEKEPEQSMVDQQFVDKQEGRSGIQTTEQTTIWQQQLRKKQLQLREQHNGQLESWPRTVLQPMQESRRMQQVEEEAAQRDHEWTHQCGTVTQRQGQAGDISSKSIATTVGSSTVQEEGSYNSLSSPRDRSPPLEPASIRFEAAENTCMKRLAL
eukprot:TRINITY_DN27448_c0_g1_i1.p1 TRINITY_DN27448_c0_g1~~TRINITY_DN27448_c0_g1_i1.p1  ORF type:complete len:921 (+),score=153.86 TRINITY_DN27448_c0_g1_i1:65-2827(+)